MSLYTREFDNPDLDLKRERLSEKQNRESLFIPIDQSIFKTTPAERVQLKAAKRELKMNN